MQANLSQTRTHFLLWVLVSYATAPILAMGGSLLYGLIELQQLQVALQHGALVSIYALFLCWVGLYCWRFIDPAFRWWHDNTSGGIAPAFLWRRLRKFPKNYWGFMFAYAVLGPLVYLGTNGVALGEQDPMLITGMLLLHFIAISLVGIPAYLIAADQLGRVIAYRGLEKIQFSIQSKIFLVGQLLPLIGYSLFAVYMWRAAGTISTPSLLLWGVLACATLLSSRFFMRSLDRSLRPVNIALHKSGGAKHTDLAQLRADSTDEIGYFSQTLGKLFGRLLDQEMHMQAVVDTAAEGIIVVDERGLIHTFNNAAQQLFGFDAQEVSGRPLSWLLPTVMDEKGIPKVLTDEHEVESITRNGRKLVLSTRISEMQIRNKKMFTCLVGDISERKAAEAQLRKAQARYRDLVETAHDLVWSMDTQGRWTYLNEAARSIYGYAPEHMINCLYTDFQSPQHAEQDAQAFASVLEGKELVQYETIQLDKDNLPRNISFNAKPLLDENNQVVLITGTARDITEQKAVEKRLAYQAEHDSLTGLFNRHFFQQELERVVARIGRGGKSCALFYIDLDQFKYVNDTLGHAAGDRLLIEISTMLEEHVRESDLLARFGGDEFTLLLYDIDSEQVMQAAENFRTLFEDYRFLDSGKSFNVTCSIGVAVIDRSVPTADEALSHADLACNMSKAHGRNRVELFDPDEQNAKGMAEDMGWAARVRDMLEKDRFRLVFQPIVSCQDGKICDYEVLMRMVCDDGQVILPGGFLPAAERFGLIHNLDRWMVRKAIFRLAQMHANKTKIRFSINLSGRAFEDPGLLSLIREILVETKLDPELLTFEITETAAIANLAAASKFIHALKEIGCQFALDDFGSGFSSFTYLKNLPVDKLKIDGSFVQNMANASVDQAMVRSMNEVAHALGKKTIAEYVEDEQTLLLLKEYGVDYVQGNFLGVPREAIVLDGFMEDDKTALEVINDG